MSSLLEIPKPSSIVVVFNGNINFLCLCNTNDSFQTIGIVLIEKSA